MSKPFGVGAAKQPPSQRTLLIYNPPSMSPTSHQLVLPSEHLAIHTVSLPPMPKHRLQTALMGALEEQLLDDPADLHFALSPTAHIDRQAGRAFEVLVCNKAWLQQLMDTAIAQGHSITTIVPSDAAQQAAGWDLAQFDFAPRSAWTQRLQNLIRSVGTAPAWRAARIGFAALLVIQLIGLNLWAWRDRSELDGKRAHIEQLLRQSFPNTPVIVDAPVQMARAVAALEQGSGQLTPQALERLLAEQKTPLIQVDYVQGTLKVVEAP